MGFSVLHLHSYGQQFETKIKISKFLVKKMFFKQNSKISEIPPLHHFIPAVSLLLKNKASSQKYIHKKKKKKQPLKETAGILMAVIFHTSVHFILGGLPYLTERSSVCNFDRTVIFLSNDSQITASYAEVLKYTVNFNMPETIILRVLIPNCFCPVYLRVYILYTANILVFLKFDHM